MITLALSNGPATAAGRRGEPRTKQNAMILQGAGFFSLTQMVVQTSTSVSSGQV